MANKIQHKRSTTGGASPTLSAGELALNLLDKRVFTANNTTVFDAFQNTASNVAITSDGTMVLQVGNTTTNAIVNSTSIKFTNSTSNTTMALPTATERGENRYLKVDGTWATVTASAAAGGSNTNIQFNDSTAIAGTNGFSFDKTTNNVYIANTLTVDGALVINSDSFAVGNTDTNTTLYGNNVTMSRDGISLIVSAEPTYGGRPMLVGDAQTTSPWKTPYQSHMGHSDFSALWMPNNGTAAFVIGMTSANTIAFTARAPATTNTFLSMQRVGQTTGATAGTTVSWRNNVLTWWRGNATYAGGFYAVSYFGVATSAAQGRAFIGFKDSITALSNGNPSAQTNIIGVGWDSGQTTMRAMSANSTASSVTDLGFNITTGNTNWYEVVIFSPPNGGTCGYRVTQYPSGSVVSGSYNTTNLPTTTTLLTWQFWGNNGSTAGAQIMDWGGVTIETPI